MMKRNDAITKDWIGAKPCQKCSDGRHWAKYVFENEIDEKYWRDEHVDHKNRAYWRHHDFMSIPCQYCGEYSPLRAAICFLSGRDSKIGGCSKNDIINYRPDNELPNILAYYSENGWSYIFFKETLSDSMCGQETFRLKHLPED